MSESRRNQSPRIAESDYRAGDRNSVGKKRIFDMGESNPPTCWGCPRWGCLVVFFVLFGIVTGLTTWLIIKNETYNTDNPELKAQYDKIKEYNKQVKKGELIDINRQVLNVSIPNPHRHYRRNFHHFEQINYV